MHSLLWVRFVGEGDRAKRGGGSRGAGGPGGRATWEHPQICVNAIAEDGRDHHFGMGDPCNYLIAVNLIVTS